ncbi:hypothetical protein T01_759 [Trichinella spiralis]|uniref:Uncharacterized protein n=1 Tax=Trichinella spiralis TaxID=6334 RepID=A0A0V1B4S0_TRISP|nr:hypothetical protein T01_759 [Trichinella spiralis]
METGGCLSSIHQMLKTKNCGLRHPMKLVPLATLVHMDIKAFPSRPSVPLLITNSILEDANVTWIELDNIYNDR